MEDDYHCMSVIVQHDGNKATGVTADMRRAPWTTCPGAEQRLVDTFQGYALDEFTERGSKKENCTHLYDLAMLAATHAQDREGTVYDIRVSDPDPDDGTRLAEVSCNDETVLSWVESQFSIVQPASAAGIRLDRLRSWIDQLQPELREAARLLQWGNMLANGRIIPLAQQSDASRMPPNCYTFQPERAAVAKRIGRIRDFSQGVSQPLDGCPL